MSVGSTELVKMMSAGSTEQVVSAGIGSADAEAGNGRPE
jgi:hypothetical protein